MKHSLYILSLFVVIAVATPSWAAEPEAAPQKPEKSAKSYTLKEMIGLAYKNAAVMREHSARMEHAEWQQYRADWAWGPKLKTSYLLAPVPEKAEVGKFASNLDQYLALNIGPFVRVKATVAMPVYTFGKIGIAQDLADIGVDVAELKRREAKLDVAFQVKRAYSTIQLTVAYQALLDEGTDIIKPKLAQMTEDREFGEGDFSTEDFRKFQIFDAEFDSRVVDNETLNDIAVGGARYFTGVEEEFQVEAFDESGAPAPLAPLETYIAVAQKTRPDWQMLKQALKARGLQVDLAKSQYFPNIAAAVDVGIGWSTEEISLSKVCRQPSADGECVDTDDLYARPYGDPFNTLSVGVGLVMEWNFDFWQLRGKWGEADANYATTKAQLDRAVGAIELEILKLHAQAAQAHAKVTINERRLQAARRWRDQFGLSVETAGADIEKGIDPMKAYFEAKVLQLKARYDYSIARAELAKGVGVATLTDIATK